MNGDLLRKVKLCFYLARMEFEKRFAGTVGGKIWVFVGPLLTIAVIWIGLDLGLGLRASSGPKYGMALAVGLTAWLFFAEGINTSISSIVGNPHLIKKVVFPVALLPLSNVMAAFVVHLLVVAVVIVALILQGQNISWNILTLPFWALCLWMLTASIATLMAGLNVIFRDLSAIVPNVVSLMFWLTPVVWPLNNVPPEWRFIALLNPVAVIAEGYRFALLGSTNGVGAFGAALLVLSLCTFALAAAALFRRVRPWFANVM